LRRFALYFLLISAPAIAVAVAVRHPIAEAVLAALVALFPVALVLVAVGGRRLGALAPALAVLALALVASLLSMLALRGQVATGPWIGGLPLAAAIQVYGVPVLMALVVIAYAASFDRFGLREEDLDSLRALGERDRGPRDR
jgi:hypothetical protein